jgi:hypothetical protein
MADRAADRSNVCMARYRCPRCHEITHRPELFAFCGICSAPLSAANLEPDDGEDHREPVVIEDSTRAGDHVLPQR